MSGTKVDWKRAVLLAAIAVAELSMLGCEIEGNYLPPDATDAPPDSPDAMIPDSYWSARYGGAEADEIARVDAIAREPNGDLVMAGTFFGSASFGGGSVVSAGASDVWVARFRSDGSNVWAKRIGGSSTDSVYSVECDDTGSIFLAGSYMGPVDFGGGARTSAFAAFLLRLDGNGQYQWDRSIEIGGRGRAYAVTVSSSGLVTMAGKFAGTVDFGGGPISAMSSQADSFVATYNASNGGHVWSRGLARDPSSVALSSLGSDVVVTASFKGTASLGGAALVATGASSDLFVARYRGTDGTHVWSFRQGASGNEYPSAIASDGSNVYVGGSFGGTTNLGGGEIVASGTLTDAFIAKYNAADGGHIWSKGYGSAGHDSVDSIAVSSSRLSVSLAFSGPIVLGTQDITPINSGSGGVDVAIVRMDTISGSPLLASHFGSSDAEDRVSVEYADDQLAGVGVFSGSVNVFGVQLDATGGRDIASFLVDF